MSNASETFKNIRAEVYDRVVAQKLLERDPWGSSTLLLDQDALKGNVRTAKTYLEILNSPGFESVPNREMTMEFETQFIAAARRLLPKYKLNDSIIDDVQPTKESREAILRAIEVMSSGIFPKL
ncbi:MAG: hypothetical protein V1858_02800 [Candidatus Gottesmanbacteria bacterium]